ncbi:uncharacterized protein LOC111137352 [Crassostrea virginica]
MYSEKSSGPAVPADKPQTPALSDFVCGPCSSSRVYSRGTIFCFLCKELFCHNCSKLHRMKEWSQNHTIVILDNASSETLKTILSQQFHRSQQDLSQRPNRWSRRAPLNEGFESKSKYLNALANNHDHETEDLDNERYCTEHQVVFCSKCKDTHSECKKTTSVVSLADKLLKRGDISQIISEYKNFIRFSDIMVCDRLNQEKQLESQRNEIFPTIQSMKNQFGQMINGKVTNIENEINEKMDKFTKSIRLYIEKCKRAKLLAQSDLDSLLAVSDKRVSGPIVKTYFRLKTKYPIYEKYLRDLYSETEFISLQFVPNEEILNLPNIVTSVGTLKERHCSSTLPPFMSVDNIRPFSERSLSYRKHGDIRLFGLGILGKGGITSVKCTTGGYIMAVARSTCEFRVFTARGWTVAHRTFSSLPWDFTFISENDVVVTLPGDKKLVTLNVDLTLRKIIQVKEVSLPEACWAVTECNGKLIGTFAPYEPNVHLKVMTLDGTPEKVIEISDSPVPFRAPQNLLYHRDKLYISDTYSHALIVTDLDGHVTFAFKSAEFENPAGITVDHQGNIYVCGKASRNVFQISGQGEVREILSPNECASRPSCVSLCGNGSILLLAFTDSNVIKSFQFK